jgi:signal transduction histidine kinase/ligand-binding sensor domain-containing protein
MLSPNRRRARAALLRLALPALLLVWVFPSFALDPRKLLTQYSRTTWTQEHGLPQDTIRAITQTSDGFLWLGTDEGLARFDGYDFTTFNKAHGDLPSNSITALASGTDGALWIGTPEGLTRYRDREFRTYTVRDGLPDEAITALYEDQAGALWIVAGVSLSRFDGAKFTNFQPGDGFPVTSVRAIYEDGHHDLWVAGFTAIVRQRSGAFEKMMDLASLRGDIVTCMVSDRNDHFWIGGNHGVIERSPDGSVRRYDVGQGLPDALVRALWVDRDGNVWAGTNLGIARFEKGRWTAMPDDLGMNLGLVRALFEDREGNLWVGSNAGLTRLRDTVFTMYGKTEGLPSDEPNAVFQDHTGRVWVGFHDNGLLMISPSGNRLYTARDGLPNVEIFSLRETQNGDLLIAARGGLIRMHDGRFTNFVPPDPLARSTVFDAIEDRSGYTWLASPGGLSKMLGGEFHTVVLGAPLLASSMVTLCQTRDGAIWAGSFGRGLWRVQGEAVSQITTAQGLSSDQIRSLYEDSDGVLWIGTFGGGLNAYRDGRFQHFTERDGLLSDNVSDVVDDGESLWLSTTRGICRIAKRQLEEFTQHNRTVLEPVNYGVEDGLRSAQCSPSYPVGGGGAHTLDGRNWFTTTRGIAVFSPDARKPPLIPPPVHLAEFTIDGRPLDLDQWKRLEPSSRRIQFRYAAIHLSAPEQVRYSYRLEGLDRDWIRAGARRTINYNSLHHGTYRFVVRAELPGGPASERSYAFEVLPEFYETAWFEVLAALAVVAAVWGVLRLRVRQIRSRFALVLEERTRLAREIHDTLAQGFVGISSQLDAVAMCMPDETTPARKYLDMARRMARHSLTEARRSVMDLRASALEGHDLAAALQSGTRMWTAGSGVEVDVDVSGSGRELPEEMEQNLLRIAQEAVTNALKHAGARKIGIKLHTEARKIYLKIRDDGRGFEQDGVFSSRGGHFGLIGMRERAERLGGELHLASRPGQGTEVEVMVPLP